MISLGITFPFALGRTAGAPRPCCFSFQMSGASTNSATRDGSAAKRHKCRAPGCGFVSRRPRWLPTTLSPWLTVPCFGKRADQPLQHGHFVRQSLQLLFIFGLMFGGVVRPEAHDFIVFLVEDDLVAAGRERIHRQVS